MDGMELVNLFKGKLVEWGIYDDLNDLIGAAAEELPQDTKEVIREKVAADPEFRGQLEDATQKTVDAFLFGAETIGAMFLQLASAGGANIPGASRFADKAPTTALAKADSAEAEDLGLTVGGNAVEAAEDAVVLLPGQTLFEGDLVYKGNPRFRSEGLNNSENAQKARDNLYIAIDELRSLRGTRAINSQLLQRVSELFEALTSGMIVPASGSDRLGSEIADDIIKVLARDPLEAKMWATDVLDSNFEHGFAGKTFIVPEAKLHTEMYGSEHVPEIGTSMQTSDPGSFGQAAGTYFQLEELLKEYPEVAQLLAEKKPGLFGPEALERLRVRNEAVREIYATDDWAEREALIEQFTAEGVFPQADTKATQEGEDLRVMGEELAELLGLQIRDAATAARQEIDPKYTGRQWKWNGRRLEHVEETPSEQIDWDDLDLQQTLEAIGEEEINDQSGRTIAEMIEAIEPNQRKLDLYSAALERDLALMVTVLRTTGTLSPEQMDAALLKVPDLAEMEEMWAPTAEGMSKESRSSILRAANLLPGPDTPMLALPQSVQKRQVTGNALLLTTGGVEQAVKGAEGAVIISKAQGSGSTALAVIDQRGNRGDTKTQFGAAIHDLVKFSREGNSEGMKDAARFIERILGKGEGALMSELAGGSSPLCKVIRKSFGDEAMARLADMAGKNAKKTGGQARDTFRGPKGKK